jgi:DNA-binding LacI/PurR family transcriptional regulator
MQDQPRLLKDLRDSVVPVVGLWQGTSPLEVPTVDVDNAAGIRAGLEHLVDLGHEDIAFVSARLLGDIREREAAFVEFMRERFGGVPDGFIRQVPNTPTGGETAARNLLGLDRPPTAIMTSTDTIAMGVLHEAHALELSVPGDLSVVGFDDILLAGHTIPALTTLRMPTADIVREGIELAVDAARDPRQPREPTVKVIAPSLIVRRSTAPPPGRRQRRPTRAGGSRRSTAATRAGSGAAAS